METMWNQIIEIFEIIQYKLTRKRICEEAQISRWVTLITIMAQAQEYIQMNQKVHITSKGKELRISMLENKYNYVNRNY